jgi:hypothetical protein
MFATFETRNPDELAGQPALAETYALARIGDGRASTLALWTATADPGAYVIEAEQLGPAADLPATAAAAVWFDGPMGPALIAAARFGFRERIAPALAGVPGFVRVLALFRDRDASSCAISLAVDLPALDAVGVAVNSTALLPGEDPALLPGPDRVETHHVTAHTRHVTHPQEVNR